MILVSKTRNSILELNAGDGNQELEFFHRQNDVSESS